MHLVLVSEYARPWPGGISEHVFHQAEHLRRCGLKVTVVTGPGPSQEGVARLGPAIPFRQNGAANRLVLSPRLLGFRTLLRRLQPDVVHVHAPLDPALSLAACLAADVPLVGTFHASFPRSRTFDLLYRGPLRTLMLRALERLAVRIAVSSEAERSIRQYFEGSWRIVPNGVDLHRFVPPESEGLEPSLLFLGRADPRKGLDRLLRVWPAVLARVPAARLTVVGAPESGVRGCAPLGRIPDSVDVPGVVPAGRLPQLVASHRVLAAPSTGRESQGIVLLEGLASGRTVICSDIPGYRGTVGSEAVRVPSDDRAWVDALVSGLAEPPSADQIATRRAHAESFAWPAIAARLKAIYEGL